MTEQQTETAILTTYVSEQVKADLVKLAAKNDRSVAAELRLAIRQHLETAKATA